MVTNTGQAPGQGDRITASSVGNATQQNQVQRTGPSPSTADGTITVPDLVDKDQPQQQRNVHAHAGRHRNSQHPSAGIPGRSAHNGLRITPKVKNQSESGGRRSSKSLPGNGTAEVTNRQEPNGARPRSARTMPSEHAEVPSGVRELSHRQIQGPSTSRATNVGSPAQPVGMARAVVEANFRPHLQRHELQASASSSSSSPSVHPSIPSTSSNQPSHQASEHRPGGAVSRPVSTASEYAININDERRLLGQSNLNLDVLNLQGHDNVVAQNPAQAQPSGMNANNIVPNEALPDILNSHMLPPYTPRQNQHRSSRQNDPNRRGQANRNQGRSHTRRPRRHRRPPPSTTLDEDDKSCCNRDCCFECITVVTTFRWVLVGLAMLGVCCVITGIILGALHMTVGSSFLTLSLMFIGLGVMLVVVVGVGWRCTPAGHEPCHLLFNLGDHSTRYVGRHRSSRPHRDRNQWYGGVMYPEFRFRRPPPSYNASMQDYQHQLMLAQLQYSSNNAEESNPDNVSLPSSPPPTYRSQASMQRPGLHITFPIPRDGDYPNSRPPTYRSHANTMVRPGLNLENRAGPSGTGVDNLACTEDVQLHMNGRRDARGAASGAASGSCSNATSASTSREGSQSPPLLGGPRACSAAGSTSSTMHRVTQALGYLDNMLEGEMRDLGPSNAGTMNTNNTATSTTTKKRPAPKIGSSPSGSPQDAAITSGSMTSKSTNSAISTTAVASGSMTSRSAHSMTSTTAVASGSMTSRSAHSATSTTAVASSPSASLSSSSSASSITTPSSPSSLSSASSSQASTAFKAIASTSVNPAGAILTATDSGPDSPMSDDSDRMADTPL